jgi:hypothetical protein
MVAKAAPVVAAVVETNMGITHLPHRIVWVTFRSKIAEGVHNMSAFFIALSMQVMYAVCIFFSDIERLRHGQPQ